MEPEDIALMNSILEIVVIGVLLAVFLIGGFTFLRKGSKYDC